MNECELIQSGVWIYHTYFNEIMKMRFMMWLHTWHIYDGPLLRPRNGPSVRYLFTAMLDPEYPSGYWAVTGPEDSAHSSANMLRVLKISMFCWVVVDVNC